MKRLGTISLETERLILRRFELSDVEKVYNSWATDKETAKYLSWDVHKNISETEEIVKNGLKIMKLVHTIGLLN